MRSHPRRWRKVPGAIVGAGTVLNEAQLAQAIDAGSQFIVSPGLTNPLALAARDTEIPFLPGVATAADIMRGLDVGLDRFKFFPAVASGGIPALRRCRSIRRTFASARRAGSAPKPRRDWLALDAVLCVGGTWFVKPGDDLATISERARAAAELAR